MNAHEFTIRRATIDDAVIINQHRRAMFADMGEPDDAKLDAMCDAFKTWVTKRLATNEYCGWLIANHQGQIVAGTGLWLPEWAPSPFDQSKYRGYVFNVYTRPDYRRRGLARQLMEIVFDYCRENKIKVVALHASDQGRALYESLGFEQTNEMRLFLVEK